eukprot:Anaeramoba_ignava/a96069_30.p1 GENE.a96069_30~~a96069_30.p1  ORF type:complete len:292 (-),score=103.40 a96069_30:39-914(-)
MDLKNEIILQPYKHICEIPGKGMRVKLFEAFDYWLKIPESKKVLISEVTEMLHNSSLIIDDIEDESTIRRGFPVAHVIYGIPACINTANLVYFQALNKCLELGEKSIKDFCEELINLHVGQAYDIYWRDNFICPTEEEYSEMVINKTGGLFRLGVKLMQNFSECKQDFIPLLNTLGQLYQVVDDYINLKSEKYMETKIYCEDLTEGKFSFPIIHGIKNDKTGKLSNILRQKTKLNDVKKFAVSIMEKLGSFDYSRKVIDDLKEKILKEIEKLGGNEKLQEIVENIVSKILV